MKRHTIRSEAEILEKFRIGDGRWVILCFHNPSYGVWNMDEHRFLTRGSFSASLAGAMELYEDRVCSFLDQPPDLAGTRAELSST